MKIDPPATSPQAPSRSVKVKSAATAGALGAEPATNAAPASAQVHPLPGAPGGSDFDAARVAAIREDIRAGRYQVHPERIASGLLARVRELLAPETKA